jgi:hypothetical protein
MVAVTESSAGSGSLDRSGLGTDVMGGFPADRRQPDAFLRLDSGGEQGTHYRSAVRCWLVIVAAAVPAGDGLISTGKSACSR